MSTDSDLRVGIIGYGLSGRVFHGPLISATQGLVVSSIVTSDPGRQARARVDHPRAQVVTRADELWEHPEEHDVVVVASPTGSHVELATRALETGLAVVVEKPLAPTADEARNVVDRAAQLGVPLSVFHNRRWDSDQLTLRRLMDERALGDVMRYESRFERWRPEARRGAWRDEQDAASGGGVLLDLGIHLVDQALTLFGPATAIYAEVLSRRGGPDDDVFVALLHRSGVLSHLWAGALSVAPGPRLRVLGSAGAFVVEHLDGQEDALRAGQVPDEPSFAQTTEDRWGRLFHGDEGAPVRPEPGNWQEYYSRLARSLHDGSPLPVEASDAVTALAVLDAARQSAGERSVVALDSDNWDT